MHVLTKEGKDWCIYDQLIDYARVIVNSLQFWNVNHVRSEANEVAHMLANKTL